MKTKTSILPLTVLAFDNPTQAAQLQQALIKLQGESVHNFQDAVVVTRNAAGKVKVHSAINAVTGSAVAGSVAGLALGAIFLLGFPGSVVGAGAGAVVGVLKNLGIRDRFRKELGYALKPGTSALAVIGTAQLDKLKERIGPLLKGCTLLQTTVNPGREAEIRKLLENQ
jgi:uncharacterized membrane protein